MILKKYVLRVQILQILSHSRFYAVNLCKCMYVSVCWLFFTREVSRRALPGYKHLIIASSLMMIQ